MKTALTLALSIGTASMVHAHTFKEWHYAGSLNAGKETTPANPIHAVTSPMTEHLCLANLSNKDATATITAEP